MIILALASGLLGLFASLALRRTRPDKLPQGVIADERFLYLSLPGFSVFLLGIATLGLVLPGFGAGGPWRIPLAVLLILAVVAVAVGAIMSAWGLFGKTVPNWALPSWKRNR